MSSAGVVGQAGGGVMKTMDRSTRNSRRGLYVGLALTLSASLALLGAGLWLALTPGLHLTTAVLTAIAGGALICVAGGVLTAAALPFHHDDRAGRHLFRRRRGGGAAHLPPKGRL